MNTPPALRGRFYPTNLTARCPSFHACLFCTGCQNYNQHSKVCVKCEEIKPPEAICRHTDSQQYTVRRLEELTKTPMTHPDQKLVDAPISVAANPDYEALLSGAMSGLGSIAPIQEVIG